MKKIMFNDKYRLTQAVLEGRKKMTRRCPKGLSIKDITNVEVFQSVSGFPIISATYKDRTIRDFLPKYRIGEVVAVEQCYRELYEKKIIFFQSKASLELYKNHDGWNNKMYVKAELMPYRIRFTNIKAERLQDISDEDCLKEGVKEVQHPFVKGAANVYTCQGIDGFYTHPQDCFADLIDKISGKGKWYRNPWVFAYEFEIIK